MGTSHGEFAVRVWIVVGIVAVAFLVAMLLWAATELFIAVFAGVLFAVMLRGLSDPLAQRTGLPQAWALTLVASALLILLGGGGWFLVREIGGQFDQLGDSVRIAWEQLQEWLGQRPWGRELLGVLATQDATTELGGTFLGHVTRIFSTTIGAVINVVVIVVIAMYVAANPGWYRRGVLRLAPPRHRAHMAHVLEAIGSTLRWWLLGRAVSMLGVGVLTTLGLWLIGMPSALALGVIAGLLDFVPFVGPILAAVPAVLAALTIGPTMIFWVALVYLVVQSIESYLLTPLVEQRSVRLPPALTITSQVLLGLLGGALGVVFATPITAAIVVIVRKLYVEETLEAKA